jgi:hypothetical protein
MAEESSDTAAGLSFPSAATVLNPTATVALAAKPSATADRQNGFLISEVVVTAAAAAVVTERQVTEVVGKETRVTEREEQCS